MKQFALCAALLIMAGVVTKAQDKDSRINLATANSASVSDNEENRTSVLASAAAAQSRPLCDIHHRHVQGRSEFATFLENSSPTLLTSCRKMYNSLAHLRALPAVVPQDDGAVNVADKNFQWSTAIKQSLIFLGVQHGYAMTQPI